MKRNDVPRRTKEEVAATPKVSKEKVKRATQTRWVHSDLFLEFKEAREEFRTSIQQEHKYIFNIGVGTIESFPGTDFWTFYCNMGEGDVYAKDLGVFKTIPKNIDYDSLFVDGKIK